MSGPFLCCFVNRVFYKCLQPSVRFLATSHFSDGIVSVDGYCGRCWDDSFPMGDAADGSLEEISHDEAVAWEVLSS